MLLLRIFLLLRRPLPAGRDEKGMQMALSSLFEIDPVFAILSGRLNLEYC